MLHLSFLSYCAIVVIFTLAICGQWLTALDENLWRYPMALMLMMLLIEWRVTRQLMPRLSIKAPERLRLGHSFHIDLCMHNPHALALNLQSRHLPAAALAGDDSILHWQVNANQAQTQSILLSAQSLGKTNWGDTYLRIKGLFGLVWWEKQLAFEHPLEIVPDFLTYKERVAGTNTDNERPSRITGNGYELLSIRDYHYGDPMRAIDWKASAKHDKYKVRIMTREQNLDLLILLDIGRYSSHQAGKLSRLHHAVNSAARLTEKAILNGDSVGLMTFADKVYCKLPTGNSLTQLSQIRQQLTKLQPIMHEPNILLACYEGLQLLSQRSLVIVLTDLERRDVDGQLIKSVNLLARKHYTVIASMINEELLQTVNKPAEQWQDPYTGLAARETLSFIENNRIRLHDYGVQTVATTPTQLDASIFKRYDMARARQQV